VEFWLVWLWSSAGFGWFGYRGETCKLYLVLAKGGDLCAGGPGLQLGNRGAVSCLAVV
jgi:hypothetical protein